MTDSMNYQGVCTIALATPGLLNNDGIIIQIIINNHLFSLLEFYMGYTVKYSPCLVVI